MLRTRGWLLLVALPASLPGHSSKPAALQVPAEFAPLDSIIVARMGESHAPGLAIGIVRGKRVVFTRGYGVRRLGAPDPVTTQSLFHMASLTKPFVATAIMQLVERRRVALDTPVTRYLPYFRVKGDGARITVRQLLTHTAGMPDVTDYGWDHPEYDAAALERYVRGLADSTLIWAPGTRYRYSNIGFEVLADVVAKVARMPFEEYVRRQILQPLGMRSSTLVKPQADTTLLTTPHTTDSTGAANVSPVFPYNRPHAGSSTLLSSVDDMNRWMLANLARGRLDGRRVLDTASYQELWRPATVTDITSKTIDRGHIGLSWFMGTYSGRRLIVHSGADVGFLSFIALAPDDSVGVIVMMNSEHGTVLSAVVQAALTAALRTIRAPR
ncbi:MAG TPA: serine hydrolase domain-containing protein [Gemmatimonadales bacterium]|nr:serine hydrolase domain-containing protein [Gemmatimonadales bacterium]